MGRKLEIVPNLSPVVGLVGCMQIKKFGKSRYLTEKPSPGRKDGIFPTVVPVKMTPLQNRDKSPAKGSLLQEKASSVKRKI